MVIEDPMIWADWMEEYSRQDVYLLRLWIEAIVFRPPILTLYGDSCYHGSDINGYGDGYGYGYGYGDGYGDGCGYGDGDGDGDGDSYGDSDGDGDSYGDSDGDGYGYGYGYFSDEDPVI